MIWKLTRKVRLYLGSWILGGDWFAVIMRLWLISDRAKAAVNRDGQVILAECEALAEALYEPIPGSWSLTVERKETPTIGEQHA